MKLFAPVLSLLVIAMAAACTEQGSSPLNTTGPSQVAGTGTETPSARSVGPVATAATRSTATVQFGQPNVGSPFPPTSGHDQSAHAVDNMVPRTVVIDKGGTVTFNTFGVHQVAIYAPGTEPGDIDTTDLVLTPAGCPKPGPPPGAPLLIDDETNRIANYPQACVPGPRTVTHTFDEPGRYLVICSFLPHFQVQMYGWVIVRD
jgi:plastocyanin